MEQSIKGQVIALALADPFLTVKDLASQAGTTTPYVRTILSEADLSLNDLRRSYARRLEQDYVKVQSKDNYPVHEKLTIIRMPGSKAAPNIPEWANLELFQAGKMLKLAPPICYMQLITPEELTLTVDCNNLRKLLPLPRQKALEVSGQKAEILPAPVNIAEILDLPKKGQSVKLTTFLTAQNLPVALEIKWFALEGLILQWSKRASELEVRLGS